MKHHFLLFTPRQCLLKNLMAISDFHSDVMSLKKTRGNGRLDNISAPDITACGIDLNPARLRLLCKNLSDNTYLGI